MILTNLNIVPGRRIEGSMGLAYGYASVKGEKNGKMILDLSGKKIPWKDSSDNFETLFRQAELKLKESGERLGGDAVVKVEGKLSRDGSGNPEMLLMGTVVKLSFSDVQIKPIEEDEETEEDGDSISIKFDGEKMSWKPPQATTPTMDVLKKMRERGKEEVGKYKDDTKQILAMAKEIGIPQDRAKLLIEGGFDTIYKIAKANTGDISAMDGINPTQARIIKKKALDMLSEE